MTPGPGQSALPRHLAVGTLILISTIFAANHVAARVASAAPPVRVAS